ncbi:MULTISPECIES: hypothetical protein [unclassified Methylobacterium]|nr:MULTISPECIES: hypothetical protein [unclassified Methylobacterium]
MSSRTCIILACLVAVTGAGLRLAVPVTPADDAFREMLRLYRTLEDRPR